MCFVSENGSKTLKIGNPHKNNMWDVSRESPCEEMTDTFFLIFIRNEAHIVESFVNESCENKFIN